MMLTMYSMEERRRWRMTDNELDFQEIVENYYDLIFDKLGVVNLMAEMGFTSERKFLDEVIFEVERLEDQCDEKTLVSEAISVRVSIEGFCLGDLMGEGLNRLVKAFSKEDFEAKLTQAKYHVLVEGNGLYPVGEKEDCLENVLVRTIANPKIWKRFDNISLH